MSSVVGGTAGAPGKAWVPPAGDRVEPGVEKKAHLWLKQTEASGVARGRNVEGGR